MFAYVIICYDWIWCEYSEYEYSECEHNDSNKFKYVSFADDINILYPSEESDTAENIDNK